MCSLRLAGHRRRLFAAQHRLHVEVDLIEGRNVNEEQQDHAQGIEHRRAADEVVEDIVGRAVAAHEEHVVAVRDLVDQVGRNAEGHDDGIGDGDVVPFMLLMPEMRMYRAAKPEMAWVRPEITLSADRTG